MFHSITLPIQANRLLSAFHEFQIDLSKMQAICKEWQTFIKKLYEYQKEYLKEDLANQKTIAYINHWKKIHPDYAFFAIGDSILIGHYRDDESKFMFDSLYEEKNNGFKPKKIPLPFETFRFQLLNKNTFAIKKITYNKTELQLWKVRSTTKRVWTAFIKGYGCFLYSYPYVVAENGSSFKIFHVSKPQLKIKIYLSFDFIAKAKAIFEKTNNTLILINKTNGIIVIHLDDYSVENFPDNIPFSTEGLEGRYIANYDRRKKAVYLFDKQTGINEYFVNCDEKSAEKTFASESLIGFCHIALSSLQIYKIEGRKKIELSIPSAYSHQIVKTVIFTKWHILIKLVHKLTIIFDYNGNFIQFVPLAIQLIRNNAIAFKPRDPSSLKFLPKVYKPKRAEGFELYDLVKNRFFKIPEKDIPDLFN